LVSKAQNQAKNMCKMQVSLLGYSTTDKERDARTARKTKAIFNFFFQDKIFSKTSKIIINK
jgi:hypothetical protein